MSCGCMTKGASKTTELYGSAVTTGGGQFTSFPATYEGGAIAGIMKKSHRLATAILGVYISFLLL